MSYFCKHPTCSPCQRTYVKWEKTFISISHETVINCAWIFPHIHTRGRHAICVISISPFYIINANISIIPYHQLETNAIV